MRATAVPAFRDALASWRRGDRSMRTDVPSRSAARPLNPSIRPKKPARPCWDTLLLLHSGPQGRHPLDLTIWLRLDEIGPEDQSMQPKSQHWIWMTLAVLALTMISYIALPPAVIKQASALLSWG